MRRLIGPVVARLSAATFLLVALGLTTAPLAAGAALTATPGAATVTSGPQSSDLAPLQVSNPDMSVSDSRANTGTPTVTPASATYHISGVVTDGSAGIGGIDVEVDNYQDGFQGTYYADVPTGSDGTWSIAVVPGSYNLRFYTGIYGVGYLGSSGFTYDSMSATKFTVVNGDIAGRNIILPSATDISGTVTDTHGHSLSGISVGAITGFGNLANSVQTASDGTYTLPVFPGSYQVHFSDSNNVWPAGDYCLAGELACPGNWASNTGSVVDASGNVSGIDVSLPDGYQITGTVTDGVSGIAGIRVDILGCGGLCVVERAYTGIDGHYAVAVAPGTYSVLFVSETHLGLSDGPYLNGYWDGSGWTPEASLAAHVTIFTESVGGVDVVMPLPISAPTGVTGTRQDGAVLVSWSAPDSDGGGAITSYVVSTYADPGGLGTQTCSTATLSCVVSGLTNGTSYSFVVTATNAWGAQSSSTESSGVIPAGTPGKPTLVTATPGNGSALVSWSSADPNGSPITGYTVTSSPDSQSCTTTGATSCTVSSLTDGRTYTFTVVATNAMGPGSPSDPSAGVAPQADAPGRPTGVTAAAGNGSALVSWTAPADNGGSDITGYEVTSSPGSLTCSTTGALSCTVSGLTNGHQYTFVVVATNDAGPSSPSDPSSSVTPQGVAPSKPTGVTATPGVGTARVSWSAPASGDVPMTYQVISSPDAKSCLTNGVLFCTVSGLRDGITYTFTVTASNDAGSGPASDASSGVLIHTGSTYHIVTPARVLDSRYSKGGTTFHAQAKQTVTIANGTSGVPTDALAVTGNVTVTGQSSLGYVTVAPSLTSGVQPTTSTINFPTGDNRANGVTVPLAAGGKLDFMYWAGSTGDTIGIIFDVTGYFSADTSGSTYHIVTPARVLDSRYNQGGTTFHAQAKQTVTIANGTSGVPTDALAVTGNVTVTGQSSLGYVTVAPSLTSGVQPTTSTINFPTGDNRANGVTVPLAAGGKLDFMYWTGSTSDTVGVIFDVTGYFE